MRRMPWLLLPLVASAAGLAGFLLGRWEPVAVPAREESAALQERIRDLEARLRDRGEGTESDASPLGGPAAEVAPRRRNLEPPPPEPATGEDAVGRPPEVVVSESLPLQGGKVVVLDGKFVAAGAGEWIRLEVVAAPSAEELLASVLDTSVDVEARAKALAQLVAHHADRLPPVIDRLLDDPSTPRRLRTAALESAAEIPPGMRPPDRLYSLAEDPIADPVERKAALAALMKLSPEPAASVLGRLLEDYREGDRAMALDLLRGARHAAFKPALERVLADEPPPANPREYYEPLARLKGRSWDSVQVTGPPDTFLAGDHHTAWAPKHQEMGPVWMELTFAEPDRPMAVRIHESYHPGAVASVSVKDPEGRWRECWSGEAHREAAPRWFEVPLGVVDHVVSAVRIVVDTDRVKGWNEIDAVELVGETRRQWAATARASSNYPD